MIHLPRTVRALQTASTRIAIRPFSIQAARMSDKPSAFDADKGSIGKEFKSTGAVGSKAQEVGGPFDKDGAIGKQFEKDGAIGGTGQQAAEQAQGDKPALFDADGAIGKQFKADGNIGAIGEAVGGPFSSKGAIGKNFNPDGAVGGTVQENLGDGSKKSS